jgi:hypothetical protein
MAQAPQRNRPRIHAPVSKKKDSEHAWSVAEFEAERQHLTSFVRENLLQWLDDEFCRRVLIRAPVKSGKREIVEYIAQRDHSHMPRRVHAFLSAWHRTADADQRKELQIHNMRVFSITKAPQAEECIRWIMTQIAAGKQVVLHLDECDFGAGERQILGKVYTRFRENPSVTFFLYSATPQEVLFSPEVDEKCDEIDDLVEEIRQTGVVVEYEPPAGYCGPARYLDEDLIIDAQPFFEMVAGGICLSEQGAQLIADFRAHVENHPRQNIIVLRLSVGDGNLKENKHIYQFLRNASSCAELNGINIITSKDEKDLGGRMGRILMEPIQWSNTDYWDCKAIGRPMIYVIDQTASRSTEFVCHDRIFAYHDYRNIVVFTTISQAQERVNHYEHRYGGFQRIRVYGHKKTFQLSAGLIDYATYMTNPWHKRKINDQEMYHIKSTADQSIHPVHSAPMTSVEADRLLKVMASFVKVKVADRVRGRVKEVPVFGCDFAACNAQSFPPRELQHIMDDNEIVHDFQNPFIKSSEKGLVNGKMQGHLRKWGVYDYVFVETKPGWGMNGPPNTARLTVCYRDDQLGVAIRWKTDEMQKINTLQTVKSMYKH